MSDCPMCGRSDCGDTCQTLSPLSATRRHSMTDKKRFVALGGTLDYMLKPKKSGDRLEKHKKFLEETADVGWREVPISYDELNWLISEVERLRRFEHFTLGVTHMILDNLHSWPKNVSRGQDQQMIQMVIKLMESIQLNATCGSCCNNERKENDSDNTVTCNTTGRAGL